MMIENEQGKVAMYYPQNTPKRVRMGDGTEYMFVVQRNVNLAWIAPEHIEQVIRKRNHCCGGKPRQQFHYASDHHVRVWTGVAER